MTERISKLQDELASYNAALEELAEGVQNLVDLDLNFLSADLKVLNEHPSLNDAPAVGKMLDDASGLLAEISERLFEIAAEAKLAVHSIQPYQGFIN